jgi:serine/threonine protein kinase
MLTEDVCRYYIRDIIKAVDCIHQNGLAHRKLTPFEILLNDDKDVIKVGDFSFSNHLRG